LAPAAEPPPKPTPKPSGKRVVITGGTRGFGFALASELLALGDSVLICGRDAGRARAAAAALRARRGPGGGGGGGGGAPRAPGMAADVCRPANVDALPAAAEQLLGGVDIWVNCAGAACRQLRGAG
jgi:NAD(P)-dependent dehydrogenase (short-subunit alcohol dehydrogenase family)